MDLLSALARLPVKPTHIILITLATLIITNAILGFGKRKEEVTVADQFRAVWKEFEGDSILNIDGSKITIEREGGSEKYLVEKTIWYQDGPPLLSYLFGKPKYAIVCDRPSTLRHIKSFELPPPTDYRKHFYFTLPDQDRMIDVEQSTYSASPDGENAGIHNLPVGQFRQVHYR